MPPPLPELPPAPPPIEAILLAAGASARMGRDKRTIPVEGEPLLRRSAKAWLAGGHDVLVVTAAHDDTARSLLSGLPVRLVANPDAARGLHTSVLAGLAAATLARALLAIALADQPLLDAGDIAALLATAAANPGRIIVPRHGGRRGNPVIFPAALARRLRDDPACGPLRRFIDLHPQLVHWHEADHPRFTTDLDTPEDARHLGLELPA